MGRLARIAIALTVAVAVFFAGTGVALAATVVSSGVVTVRVHETGPDGTNLYVPVPAALLDLALGIAEVALPAKDLAQMRTEAAPYQPMIRTMARELERCPDAMLVNVMTNDESVQVTKRGGTFVVQVDAPDAHVHVAFPAHTVARVARFLDV